MRRFTKTAFAAIALILLMQLPFSSDAYAITRVVNDRKGVIDDGAELFTSEQEKLLLEQITKILDRGNAAVVTAPADSDAARQSAESIYQNLFGSKNGTMLLIEKDKDDIQFFSQGENSLIITDSKSREIADSVQQHAKNGEYFKCADEALSQVIDLLDSGHIVSVFRHVAAALLGISTVLLAGVWIALLRRRFRTAKK
ncbi:MAG: TPM domain-containing protein [Lachnospiraceae bacterium]|nr:TPM domain-containing protein [Lachnospiraceae bacterium]